MSFITISDGITTINLPPELQWRDEFAWTRVEHSTDYSLTGSLVVQEGVRQDGRPITLYGGTGSAWATRSTIEALYALASIPNQVMTLNLWGTVYSVIFRRPAIEAQEIVRIANPTADQFYSLTLNLMEITP